VIRAVTIMLLAVPAGIAAAVIARTVNQEINPVFVVAVTLVATALGLLAHSIRSGLEPIPLVVVEPLPEPNSYRGLVSLEERMSWGAVDRHRFDERVRPHLLRIAAERLRQRHGVRLADQPGQARDIMGEQLWTFLTAPPDPAGKPVGRRELERVVRNMEAL
jgi:hypothetical protein